VAMFQNPGVEPLVLELVSWEAWAAITALPDRAGLPGGAVVW
jgi:hypothetical protein